ncbi:MAG: DUF5126 domain-containing protein [Tannerella sp.]|nr:DUF5126 domain-containing protein [Tannerella sp.]
MKDIIKNLACSLFCTLSLFSCSEQFRHEPTGVQTAGLPLPVNQAQVKRNIPGGAVIGFDIKGNTNAAYIKAVFTGSDGAERNVIVSSYVDTLTIRGLGNTDARTVRLYAVNRQEKTSSPVEVVINPLTPPVEQVFGSLKYAVDFGGFVIDFGENVEKDDLAIHFIRKDSTGSAFEPYDALYTSLESGVFVVRDLPAVSNEFGLFIRDRWDNISDTLIFSATPMREDYLNKKLFKRSYPAGDVMWNFFSGGAFERAYDDIVSNGNYAHTDYPVEFPHRYTLDLGVNVILSRFRLWQRPGSTVLYQHGAPKYYKVYGRADDPGFGNAENVLEGWTLLRECTSFKPSGLPLGQYSAEDEEYNGRGEEFSFPRDIQPIRYIRFEFLESWSGMKCSVVSELAFWGEIIQ